MTQSLTPDHNMQLIPGSGCTTPPSHSAATIPVRQSSRKRIPLVTPGFVPTQANSRKSLQTQNYTRSNINQSSSPTPGNQGGPTSTQETSNTINSVAMYDLEQNSDDENAKVSGRSAKSKEDKKLKPCKDGTENVLVYFSQIENGLTYRCLWCPMTVKASTSSYYNLKFHCDGSNIKGTIQAACPN
ncbi:hypothetical protein PGT21_010756 [Puccinia graminis f. sp. tritici]|uniref:Uncharacterized protein n=1 Tax=Puccinia graminis f. sp. tritici TaxID=56615 RepID=A0A5B0MNG6_PUCGR|nr:hypothetical protein PGT21_010756 [Puccinia graminis f. sp. tritici]